LPDFNEATSSVNGRLFRYGRPIGLIKFWRNSKHVTTARLLVLGVRVTSPPSQDFPCAAQPSQL
jgi:hypothetical protein